MASILPCINPMKIIYCVNHFWPSIGGGETVSQHIVDHLSKSHDVCVITRRLTGRGKYKIPIHEYTPGKQDVLNFIKEKKPDIVFIYSDVFDFFRQILTEPNKQFKLIISLCGANWLYEHKNAANLLYRNLSDINYLIVHSKLDRDFKLCNNPELIKKTIVIPNGVDLAEFDSNKMSRNMLHSNIEHKIWILNISNFFPGKGQEHIIPILNKLPNQTKLEYIQICSDISFSIGQQLESKWKKICATLLNKEISYRLIKNPTRESIIAYFKNSNVFCFTSEKEVAPLVLLEAMAAKLPWISTDVGNAKELSGGKCIESIKRSNGHSYFDSRVYNLFASGIKELLITPCIAENGRLSVEKYFAWDKILPKYSEMISSRTS